MDVKAIIAIMTKLVSSMKNRAEFLRTGNNTLCSLLLLAWRLTQNYTSIHVRRLYQPEIVWKSGE
jgi:hypothetical protein